jgi:hypothetical protein
MSRLRSDAFDFWVAGAVKVSSFQARYGMLNFHDYLN